MEIQLKKSGIKTEKIKKVDLSWSFVDIDKLVKNYTIVYVLIFLFVQKKAS